MGSHVFKNIALRANALNLSTYATQVGFTLAAEAKETTALDDSSKTFLAGLLSSTVSYNGWDDVVSDAEIFALPGSANAVLLSFGVEPNSAVGTVGYTTRGRVTSYEKGSPIGEVAAYTLQVQGTGFAGRGVVGANGTHTATANQTGSQQGALSATQTMYSALHVDTVSGTTPTLDVTIESDDNGSFTTPTTRITHTQLTAAGSELSSVAGAITDDYWRVVLTIGGTTPSFRVFVVLAIV